MKTPTPPNPLPPNSDPHKPAGAATEHSVTGHSPAALPSNPHANLHSPAAHPLNVASHTLPTHVDLQAMARQCMIEHGFEPEYPPGVAEQLKALRAHPPVVAAGGAV